VEIKLFKNYKDPNLLILTLFYLLNLIEIWVSVSFSNHVIDSKIVVLLKGSFVDFANDKRIRFWVIRILNEAV